MDEMKPASGRMRWLRVFEPLMVVTGLRSHSAPCRLSPSLYLTHSQHASGQSLPTWCIFLLATSLWVVYGLLDQKAPVYVGNIIGVVMNLIMVVGILILAGFTH